MKFPKPPSKFVEHSNPEAGTGGSDQPTKMKSNSQLHRDAVREDNGEI